MVATTAMFIIALSGAGDPDTLASGAAFERSPWVLDVRLDSPLLGISRHPLMAQAATRASDATPAPVAQANAQTVAVQTPVTVQAPAAQTTAQPPTAGDVAAPSECAQCDIDCDTCRESERQARYLLRRRERNLRTHRAFAIAAWAGLGVTEVLGTILAINKPTWFGDGACLSAGGGVFGDFGCGSGLVSLHQTFAFATTGLYVTAGVIAATAPDPDNAASGDDPASGRLRLHKTLAWVHAGGMILLPILGIIAANPQLVGIDPGADAATARNFSSAMRSIHTIVGYTTFAAFSFSAALELF